MPLCFALSVALASPFSAAYATDSMADRVAWHVVAAADNQGLPFVIVDKLNARVTVFDARGRLIAETPALLGLARGDHSVPGIGDRPLAKIRPEERTTPAGRFVGEAGRNNTGEHVIWIDYDAALSLHRVRDRDRLHQRLVSTTTADNRASYGCVTVSVQFYEKVVRSTFGRSRGIVYILPETKSADEVFGFLRPLT